MRQAGHLYLASSDPHTPQLLDRQNVNMVQTQTVGRFTGTLRKTVQDGRTINNTLEKRMNHSV